MYANPLYYYIHPEIYSKHAFISPIEQYFNQHSKLLGNCLLPFLYKYSYKLEPIAATNIKDFDLASFLLYMTLYDCL